MKRKELLLLALLVISLCVSIFILSTLSFSSQSTIDGGATSETTALSLTIAASETASIVPPSGNLTPSTNGVKERITKITSLTEGWAVNITTYGRGFPSIWDELEPNSSQIGDQIIEYFEINVNASTAGGSYALYFNVTQAELTDLNPTNISLFVFDTSWQNLSTVIVSENSDPAQFYGLTTHFSKFLIAERVETQSAEEEEGEAVSGSNGGGSAAKKSTGKKSDQETSPETKPEENKLLKPIRQPGSLFDVSLVILEKYRRIFPSGIILGEISLSNIKKIGLVPVQIEYLLQDAEGNILFRIYETKTIENEITFIKELALPEDIKAGNYMFFIQVKYEEDIALAGYPFEVVEPKVSALVGLASFLAQPKIIAMALPLILLLIIITTVFLLTCLKNRKLRKRHK